MVDLLPHQQRVVAERDELAARREKLMAFIAGDVIKTLPQAEQMDLADQWNVMTAYQEILERRIARFMPQS